MFSDIGPLEVVTLIVLAVILVGPDKLPKMVSDTARTLRKVRELSQSTQASIRDELPPELRNLTLEDLNPKALVAKNLLSAESLSLTDLTTGFDLEEEPPGSAAGETSKKPGESVGPGSKSTTAGHRP
ncbi:Sec-independent protein translocase subunit TatB [Streptomyces sp. NPDC005134]|uniref:Sec-independent protein translocase subunit TatB n=1 Tax=Streptomyces sp. NPDC005077 TaxID=3154292 RepID=UPI0033A294D7